MSLEFSTLRTKFLDGHTVFAIFKNMVTPGFCQFSNAYAESR